MARIILAGFAAAFLDAGQAAACGPETDCEVADGTYRVALPEGGGTGAPAVLWLHGFGRSGAMMANKPKRADPWLGRGYVVIAPDGQAFEAAGNKQDWGVNDSFDWARDDLVFLGAVVDDAVARFGIDRTRLLVAGFSRGGSMTWDLACRAPGFARAYAAASGSFWEPMYADCEGPAHLLHAHGFGDRLVPFEGRQGVFVGLAFEQGSVVKGLNVWRGVNGCTGWAEKLVEEGAGWRKSWPCEAGSITLILHPAGHRMPEGWADTVLDWFEALP